MKRLGYLWLLAVGLGCTVPAAAGTRNLTSNSLNEDAPKANRAGQAVWSAWDGSHYQIYYWDGVSQAPVQVTNNLMEDRYPQISPNGTVATWMRWDGSEWEII